MRIDDVLDEPYDMEADFTRTKETLVKLYSEGTHFVYELLQNAEDADATCVSFRQFTNRLEVLHDGKPFTRTNIQSLRTIANSDKVNINNNIGKFGIGFLSVFTICKTVELYSEPSNRQTENSLERFAREIDISKKFNNINKEWKLDNPYTTKFVFPYCVWYETDKSPEDLKIDVTNKLNHLCANVLLFLKNIQKIEYVIYKDDVGENIDRSGSYELKREKVDNNFYKVKQIGKTNENGNSWFVFSKSIDNTEKSVDIAFSIIEKGNNVEFKRLDVSYISAYFPTEMKSGLNFIVQAPFELTPNRGSLIKDSKRNDDLFHLLYELLKEAVCTFKDKNMLSLELISLLPYKTMDNLKKLPSKAMDNLRDGMLIKRHLNLGTDDLDITDILKTEAIIPAIDGKYIKAVDAKIVRGAKNLLELFEGNKLCDLLSQPDAKWLSGDFTETSRLKELHSFFKDRDGLNVEQIGSNDLPRLIENNPDFLKKVDNEWLVKFYNYLSNDVEGLLDKSKKLVTIPFIKTTNGDFNAPFVKPEGGRAYEAKPNIFLRPKSATSNIEGFLFVDNFIEQNCPDLIEALDIKKPDGLEYFKHELESGKNIEPNDNANILQVKQAVHFIKSDPEEVIDTFKYLLWLKVINGNAEFITCSSGMIYREKDFNGESIKEYFYGIYWNVYILDEQFYLENGLTPSDLEILEKIGILNNIYENRSQTDWKEGNANCLNIGDFRKNLTLKNIITVLEFIKEHSSIKESKTSLENIKYTHKKRKAKQKSAIILTMLKNVEEHLQGKWQYSSTNPEYREDVSVVVEQLKKKRWLFDKNGSLVSPSEISRYDLDTDIYGKIDEKSNIYEILGFKKTEQDKQSKIVQEIKTRYTTEEIELIIQHFAQEETNDVFDPDIENDNESFPNDPIKNLLSLQKMIKKLYDEPSSEVKYEYRWRLIRTSRGNDREHLKPRYNGYCQICQHKRLYWDVAEIFEKPKKELEQMNLSLCLNHAREYRQLRKDENLMSSFITNILGANPEKDTVVMLGEKKIKFTNTHLAEIQEILRIETEGNSPQEYK